MREEGASADLLLPRVARGEADAVDACLARYGPLVWSLARKLSRDVAGLEDLVQEIFIDIWKSAGRFDPAKAPEPAFVAVIARRRIVDRRRRAARAPEHEALEESSGSTEHAAFSQVDLEDEARRARRALSRLAPEQRRLILMSVVEGLTHQEIATATGLPLGTVKSHIRRGLDKAAQALRAADESDVT
jgi:RNA polymerase sigma-70 factor (ECF subfamily)